MGTQGGLLRRVAAVSVRSRKTSRRAAFPGCRDQTRQPTGSLGGVLKEQTDHVVDTNARASDFFSFPSPFPWDYAVRK